jgi:hypothetical protein
MSSLPNNQAIDELIYQQDHKLGYIIPAVICIGSACLFAGLVIAMVIWG